MASSIHTDVRGAEAAPQPARPQPTESAVLAPRRRWGWGIRLRGAAIAAVCIAMLATAATLTPHRSGAGTHQQLDLPGCGFLARTGQPCPSCGMTTSMAAMASGQIALAARAHPFGVVLFVAVVAAAIVGVAELASGRNVLRYLRPSVWWLAAGVGGMLGGWAIKLTAIYLSGGAG